MPKTLTDLESQSKAYDPRWFIWTIVFLIVTGVSLVSYILITSSSDDANLNDFSLITHMTRTKAK